MAENNVKFQVIVGCCKLNDNPDKMGIGITLNNLPTMSWSFKNDMDHFRNTTTGNFVLMGRNTWESIPEKFRPLPNRINIIVSSNADKLNEEKQQKYNLGSVNIHFVKSIDEGINYYIDKNKEPQHMHKELFIIGGENIYTQVIEKYPKNIDKLFITMIDNIYPCDKYFPIKKYLDLNPKLIFDMPKKNDVNSLSVFKENITYCIKVYKF